MTSEPLELVPDTVRLQAASPSAIPRAISRRRFWIKNRSSGLVRNPTSRSKEGMIILRQKAIFPVPVSVSGLAPRLGNWGRRRTKARSISSAWFLRSVLLAM